MTRGKYIKRYNPRHNKYNQTYQLARTLNKFSR
jgi:hypothetical protein